MLHKLILGIFLALSLPLSSQPKFRNNAFYVVCRGSEQKLAMIADGFNLKDKNITHIGIGIVKNGMLRVYNVTNTTDADSALICQNLQEFGMLPDIHYLSIWEYRCSRTKRLNMRKIIETMAAERITFDMDFNVEDDDRLYCSEFCAKVLLRLDPDGFQFPLTRRSLNNFYQTVLNREHLDYYPVDFFQSHTGFRKIYEQYFD